MISSTMARSGPRTLFFDRELLYAHRGKCQDEANSTIPAVDPWSVRAPLRKLFEEKRDPASCSSSEADDLDGVAARTYCVWKPKSAAEEWPSRCAKSNLTGSSKRWRFWSLIHRSNSDGKDTFVFLTPKPKKDETPTSTTKNSDLCKS